jgi:hypothetical protein
MSASTSLEESSSNEEEMLSELDRDLKSKVVRDVEALLAWWYENWGSYPRLWRMVCD